MRIERTPQRQRLVQLSINKLPFIYQHILGFNKETPDYDHDPDTYETRKVFQAACHRADKLCYLIHGQPYTYHPSAINQSMLGSNEEEKSQLIAAASQCVDRHIDGVHPGVLLNTFQYDFVRAFGVMNWEDLIRVNDLPSMRGFRPDIHKVRNFVNGREFPEELKKFAKSWFTYSLYGVEQKPFLHSRVPTFWDITYIMNLEFAGLNIPIHLNSISYDPENPEKGVEVSSLKIAGRQETELESQISSRIMQLRLLAVEMLTNSHIANGKALSQRIIDRGGHANSIPRAFYPVVYWERVYNPRTNKITSQPYQFSQESRQDLAEWLKTIGDALNPPKKTVNEEFAHQPPLL